MESLPTELVREILLRLPATTIVDVVQSVCRSWRTLVRDPHFACEHLSTGVGGGYLVQHCGIREVRTGRRDHLLTYVHDVDTLHGGMWSAFVPLCGKLPYFDRIAQTCDGLILLVDHSGSDSSKHLVHICNPLLGRWITLPEESYDSRIVQCSFMRLALDAASMKYKVFRVTWLCQERTRGYHLLCDIMSVGTGRDSPAVQLTKFCPYQLVRLPGLRNGILSDGQLYWLVWKGNRLPAMMSIDVRSERIDFTSNLGMKNSMPYGCCPLAINGRLCLTSLHYEPYLGKYRIRFCGRRRESSPAATDHPSLEPLNDCLLDYCSGMIVTSYSMVHEMGRLLVCDTKWEYMYDLRTNMTRPLRTPKYFGYKEIELIDYTPSLLVLRI